MIYKTGIDIIEIKRIEMAIQSNSFVKKIFTDREAAHCKSSASFAGIFAAKEAIAKALGCGFRFFSLLDIEILNDELGAPYVVFFGPAKQYLEQYDIQDVSISISHCKEYACAVAISICN